VENGGPIENPVFDAIEGLRGRICALFEGSLNLGLPVALDQVFKVLTISWSGVGNVMVREPTLKLGLVPFVVD
jgi:hypothetical protein